MTVVGTRGLVLNVRRYKETERLFKVSVDLPEESPTWPPFSTERIFVQKTAIKSEGQVRSIPYFAQGIAYDDIVRVGIDNVREELTFQGVVRESGHSTIRILFDDEKRSQHVAALLTEFGCDWEVTTIRHPLGRRYPANHPVRQCCAPRLVELESAGLVSFEEAAISSVHQAQLT